MADNAQFLCVITEFITHSDCALFVTLADQRGKVGLSDNAQ